MSAFFSEYIKNIITVGICAYICEWVCGIGSSGGMKKVISFIAGLCIFTVAAIPFAQGLKSFSKEFSFTQKAAKEQQYNENAFLELTQTETQKQISALLESELGIQDSDVRLSLEIVDGSIQIQALSVYIHQRYSQLQEKTSMLLNEIYKDAIIIYTGAQSNEQG